MQFWQFRELQQRFLESRLAQCKENLAVYEVHLEKAKEASRLFPESEALRRRLAVCEHLRDRTQRQIEDFSRRLAALRK